MFQLTRFSHNTVFFRNQNARYAGTRCNTSFMAVLSALASDWTHPFPLYFLVAEFLLHDKTFRADSKNDVWFYLMIEKEYGFRCFTNLFSVSCTFLWSLIDQGFGVYIYGEDCKEVPWVFLISHILTVHIFVTSFGADSVH